MKTENKLIFKPRLSKNFGIFIVIGKIKDKGKIKINNKEK
jgi:hypothetical protein